jgi:hypothetical protein
MVVRHSTGEWYGLVTPAGIALLPPEVPLATVEQIWRDLGGGRGLSAVIDALVGVFGMSLSGLPSFAVVSLAESDAVRTALRGDVSARLWLPGDDEPVAISGSGVTSWNERAFGHADRAELAIGIPGSDDLLPIVEGVVRTGRLLVEALGDDGGDGSVRVLPRVGSRPEPRPLAAEAPSEPAPAGGPLEEAAAVRAEAVPEQDELARAASTPVSLPVPPSDPVPGLGSVPVPELPVDAAGSVSSLVDPEPEPAPASSPEPAAPAPEAARGAETLVAEEAPNEYDRLLFGETVLSSVEAAAVRAEEPELTVSDASAPAPAPIPPSLAGSVPPPPPPLAGSVPPPPPPPPPGDLIGSLPSFEAGPAPSPVLGDHDGETVLVEDIQHLLGGLPAPSPLMHGAPPARPVPQLVIAGRPSLPLDRTAVVGTRPRLSRVQGDKAPQLVAVESPNGEVSRSHVELRVEGSNVLAVDLNSTNGTVLLREGSDPVRLQPAEPSILVPGDRIDLGDGVILGFEGLT